MPYSKTNVKKPDLLYPEESYKIVGACKEIYQKFGGAFKETIVDKALTIALEKEGLKVESQKRINIYYEGVKVGTYIPDKIVNEKIMLEVKCKTFITTSDEKQFWHYFQATDYKLGFLINFGTDKLDIRRRIYDLARK